MHLQPNSFFVKTKVRLHSTHMDIIPIRRPSVGAVFISLAQCFSNFR
jgi:hypothetical protein